MSHTISHTIRVAVADDEMMMRLYFEEVLPDMGYEVVSVAGDGAELVRHVLAHRPDVILSDIRMPVMDGIEAVRSLCSKMPLPVVLISGHDYEERVKDVEDACILAYLTKPVAPGDIREAVDEVLEKYEEFGVLREEEQDVAQALAGRRDVERAKLLLMHREHTTSAQAFQELRALASETNLSLIEAARHLLETT